MWKVKLWTFNYWGSIAVAVWPWCCNFSPRREQPERGAVIRAAGLRLQWRIAWEWGLTKQTHEWEMRGFLMAQTHLCFFSRQLCSACAVSQQDPSAWFSLFRLLFQWVSILLNGSCQFCCPPKARPKKNRKKNSERSLITQQALEVENTRAPTPCKQAICIREAITTALYPYLIGCPSSEVRRGC